MLPNLIILSILNTSGQDDRHCSASFTRPQVKDAGTRPEVVSREQWSRCSGD